MTFVVKLCILSMIDVKLFQWPLADKNTTGGKRVVDRLTNCSSSLKKCSSGARVD